jgi:hypothetical protein
MADNNPTGSTGTGGQADKSDARRPKPPRVNRGQAPYSPTDKTEDMTGKMSMVSRGYSSLRMMKVTCPPLVTRTSGCQGMKSCLEKRVRRIARRLHMHSLIKKTKMLNQAAAAAAVRRRRRW